MKKNKLNKFDEIVRRFFLAQKALEKRINKEKKVRLEFSQEELTEIYETLTQKQKYLMSEREKNYENSPFDDKAKEKERDRKSVV